MPAMTPRLPLVVLACAAVSAAPASAATVRPGTWSGYGSADVAFASMSGSVTWTGTSSFCSVDVNGVRGTVSCGGGVAFSALCAGTATPVSVTLACADSLRNLYVEVAAAMLPTGRFAGTITYERL